MRKTNIKDERVLSTQRQFASEALQLLMIYLIASILVQQFVFNAPFSAYAVEFFGFFGASIYIIIRNLIYGNNLFGQVTSTKKTILRSSLVTGITITTVSIFLNTQNNSSKLSSGESLYTYILVFFIGTLGTFFMYLLLGFINTKRIQKIDQDLNDLE